MITLIARLVGPKLAMPVLVGLAVLLLIGGTFTLSRCTKDHSAERQAEQTTASSEAIANAAKSAIDTIGAREATENDINYAVAHTQKDITDAPDPDAVRRSVIAGLCQQASHRFDPACSVR